MNILEEISQREIEEFKQRKNFFNMIKKYGRLYPVKSFFNALKPVSMICEFKPASPVKGIFIQNPKIDIRNVINIYEKSGCKALSVLTNKRDFKGDPLYISYIKSFCDLPILYKNFILLEKQIDEAYLIGADCVLLIVSILDSKRLRALYNYATHLGIDTLIEIHNDEELKTALKLEPKIIGINNRNLKTFTVDINNTFMLSKNIPNGIKIISESGIQSSQEIERLFEYGISGALIGEIMVKLALESKSSKIKEFLINRVN
jgi:indole-3-glycerol phosphate synthase